MAPPRSSKDLDHNITVEPTYPGVDTPLPCRPCRTVLAADSSRGKSPFHQHDRFMVIIEIQRFVSSCARKDDNFRHELPSSLEMRDDLLSPPLFLHCASDMPRAFTAKLQCSPLMCFDGLEQPFDPGCTLLLAYGASWRSLTASPLFNAIEQCSCVSGRRCISVSVQNHEEC